MLAEDQINQLKNLVSQAQEILIMFPAESKLDLQLAASALFLSLEVNKQKQVSFFTNEDLEIFNSATYERFAGFKQLKDRLGNKNLQVSFPYNKAQVEKVSYDIDEEQGRFFLVVQPEKGTKPLDYKQVEFAYTGASADLVILLGITDFEDLGHLYKSYGQLFQDSTTVVINNYEPGVGDVKLDLSGKSGLAEGLFALMEQLELGISNQAATNLLYAIEENTQGLSSYTASADTFEAVAKLMRLGARRIKRTQVQPQASLSVSKAESQPKLKTDKKSQDLFVQALNKKKPETSQPAAEKAAEEKAGGLDFNPGGLRK